VGGAMLMSIEHSPRRKRASTGAWPQIGVPAGMCVSAGVDAIISFLISDVEFAAWGWRIALLLSAVLVMLGIYIRMRIFKTPAFLKMKEIKKEVRGITVASLITIFIIPPEKAFRLV
jgi:MFS transporter, MHS family, shikimate and dehydroshikimate transport protein